MNSADAASWYVKATAKSAGNGSEAKPFNTLADAEAASGAGDTIYILPSHSGEILDGQITLKPDQKLIGLGPDMRDVPENAAGARITYSGGGGEGYPDGAIVQLSSGNEIANIHFKDLIFGGIVGIGVDYSGTKIHDNLFSGVGTRNFYSRYSVYLESYSGDSEVTVQDNVIRNGEDLGGVVVFQLGDSTGTYHFQGNHFDNIGFRAHAFVTFDTASIQADILDSSANNIGAFGEFSDVSNADSILMQLSNSSTQNVLVQNYHYDNTKQVGGVSNTGLELFFPSEVLGWPPSYWADGAQATLKISDSTFKNAVTEAIQVLNTGINSLMDVEITNTAVIDAKPRQVASFGLGFAGGAIAVVSQFFGSSGNQTFVKMENCDILGSTAYAVGAYDLGATGFSSDIDMGGGILGSIGHNRILENVTGEIELYQTDGSGKFNWWGENPPRVDSFGGGVFDVDPVLLADPRP